MTFLELAQKLREKCGATGTGPTAVTAQVGEYLDIVNLINEAWREIQLRSAHWKWMRKDFSFATTASKNFYLLSATAGESLITDLARWHVDTLRMYRSSIGRTDEQFLVFWDYPTWRDTYDFGGQTLIVNRPSVFSVRDKDKALLLGDNPDDIYTVTGQYQQKPVLLAADADEPGLPSEFHMVIVYLAMVKWAAKEVAPEIAADGREGYDKFLAMLEDDQLPPIEHGGPLA